MLGYDENCTGRGFAPSEIISIKSREHLIEILKSAQSQGRTIHPISTGKNWGYGSASPLTKGSWVVDLSRLNQIIPIHAGLGLVQIEPGVTQQQLHEFLQRNQWPFLVPTTGAGPTVSVLANALERGFGLTPVADHFMQLNNLEVLMTSGEVVQNPLSELGAPLLGNGFKWGIGPFTQGLFTQSSLGIVLSGTLALAPRSEVEAVVVYECEKENELEKGLLAIQKTLFECGGNMGGFNFMNALRLMTMRDTCPELYRRKGEAIPEEFLEIYFKKHHLKPWVGIGNILCTKKQFSGLKQQILSNFKGQGQKAHVLTTLQIHRLEMLTRFLSLKKINQNLKQLSEGLPILFGVPQWTAMPLTRWRSQFSDTLTPNNPDTDDVGLLWYAPLIPFDVKMIGESIALIQKTCRQFNMDAPITLTCIHPRTIEATIPLLFDRHQPEQLERAHQLYKALFEAGQKIGILPYRLGTVGMDLLLNTNIPSQGVWKKIKIALDEKQILSPQKYIAI